MNYTNQFFKTLIKKKVDSSFIDNICGTDIVDRQFISKFNKRFRFLLCVIDIHIEYGWVILLKDKKGITINYAFHKALDESKHKPNTIWAEKGSEFYKRAMKPWVK